MYALLKDMPTCFAEPFEGKGKVLIYIFKIVTILLAPYPLLLNPVITAIAAVFEYKKAETAFYEEGMEEVYGFKLTYWKFVAVCYAIAGRFYKAIWTIW